jgi:hypothetical protein
LVAHLTKLSGLVSGVGKAVGKVMGATGRVAKAHPMGALAATAGTAAGLSVAKDNIAKGNVGFDPAYQAAQRWDGAPAIRPNKGTPVNYLPAAQARRGQWG